MSFIFVIHEGYTEDIVSTISDKPNEQIRDAVTGRGCVVDRAVPELYSGLISEGQLRFNLRSALSLLGIPREQAAFPAAMGRTGLYHWQRAVVLGGSGGYHR